MKRSGHAESIRPVGFSLETPCPFHALLLSFTSSASSSLAVDLLATNQAETNPPAREPSTLAPTRTCTPIRLPPIEAKAGLGCPRVAQHVGDRAIRSGSSSRVSTEGSEPHSGALSSVPVIGAVSVSRRSISVSIPEEDVADFSSNLSKLDGPAAAVSPPV